MPDWTALAGFAGLASALDEIQNRRVKEAQLQKELTAGQGERLPMGGSPSGWGVLDQFLGTTNPARSALADSAISFAPMIR